MKSFLTVNNMLRSCKLAGVQTRSSKLLHQYVQCTLHNSIIIKVPRSFLLSGFVADQTDFPIL